MIGRSADQQVAILIQKHRLGLVVEAGSVDVAVIRKVDEGVERRRGVGGSWHVLQDLGVAVADVESQIGDQEVAVPLQQRRGRFKKRIASVAKVPLVGVGLDQIVQKAAVLEFGHRAIGQVPAIRRR